MVYVLNYLIVLFVLGFLVNLVTLLPGNFNGFPPTRLSLWSLPPPTRLIPGGGKGKISARSFSCLPDVGWEATAYMLSTREIRNTTWTDKNHKYIRILDYHVSIVYTRQNNLQKQTDRFTIHFCWTLISPFGKLKIFRWSQLINCPTCNDNHLNLIFILQNN